MGVKYSEVIERMKLAGRLKNDSRVARVLGITPQALSNYKKRGSLPSDLVLKFASLYSISVDWLLTGEGAVYRTGYKSNASIERSYRSLKEQSATYGEDNEIEVREGQLPSNALPTQPALTPEEIIFTGKLLKILRSSNKTIVDAVKCSLDVFLKASNIPDD